MVGSTIRNQPTDERFWSLSSFDLTHSCAIQGESIAINSDWVYAQAGKPSHNILDISHSFIYNNKKKPFQRKFAFS